jgi:hypothetical protein
VSEPFRTFFQPAELGRELTALGVQAIEDLGPDAINQRFFAGRRDGLCVASAGRIVLARRER